MLFGLLLYCLDQAVASLLSSNRPLDYRSFVESRKSFFTRNSTPKVLFIGDSHVADAINTKVLDSILKTESYNLGVYHASPFDNYYVLKKVIDRGLVPKVLALGTNYTMFYRKAEPSKYIPIILSDFKSRTELVLNSTKGFEPGIFIESLNEKYLLDAILNSFRGIPYKPTRDIESVYNGSLVFKNQSENVEWKYKPNKKSLIQISTEQVSYFRRIIQLAQEKGIKVVILNPPIWKEKLVGLQRFSSQFHDCDSILTIVAKEFGVPIYNRDYQTMNSILVRQDFLDAEHLNWNGAVKYTVDFSRWFAGSQEL